MPAAQWRVANPTSRKNVTVYGRDRKNAAERHPPKLARAGGHGPTSQPFGLLAHLAAFKSGLRIAWGLLVV